ncbi:MAG: RodZ domain-containing protein [Thermodesulfovibrionales bacterium]
MLKETRSKEGLSLEEIAARTHIRIEYLKGIEQGDFSKIPSEIYVRGYLKSYAEILGLDEDEILALYCEEKGDTDEECVEEVQLPVKKGLFREYVAIAIGVLVCILIVFVVIRYDYIKTSFLKKKQTGEVESAVGTSKRQLIRIIANDTSWIMMVIDNEKVEEYVLKRGDVLIKEGHSGFYLKIGNAGGVSIFLNNENVGYLGGKGKVVNVAVPQNFKLGKAFKKLFQTKKPVK